MSPSHARLYRAFREFVGALFEVAREIIAARSSGQTFIRRFASARHRVDLAMRRRLARAAGLSPEEVAARFSGTKPVFAAAASSTVDVTVASTSPARPRRPTRQMSNQRSVLPPDIEHAVSSQLITSHRDRLSADAMVRFVVCLGVARGDVRGALTILRARNKRDYVIASDLADIQAWISKGWIEAQRHQLGDDFMARVCEEVGASGELDAATLRVHLRERGYSNDTADDIARRLLIRADACASA